MLFLRIFVICKPRSRRDDAPCGHEPKEADIYNRRDHTRPLYACGLRLPLPGRERTYEDINDVTLDEEMILKKPKPRCC